MNPAMLRVQQKFEVIHKTENQAACLDMQVVFTFRYHVNAFFRSQCQPESAHCVAGGAGVRKRFYPVCRIAGLT